MASHPLQQLRRPGVQLVQILIAQRVLVLRIAAAAADLKLLRDLQESVAPARWSASLRSRFTTSSAVTRPGAPSAA
jgi:hypothetical protein